MARPREFDLDDALRGAMDLFWRHGYEATSMQDLVDALGIKKGSLYAAFGDKRRLFLAALRHYDKLEVAGAIAILDAPGDGVGQIGRLFDSVVAVVRSGDRRGCLLCNAAVEEAPADPEVSEYVRAAMARMERAFGRALQRSPDADDKAAQALTTAYMGLRVMAKAGLDAEELAETATRLVSGLSTPTRM